MLRNLIRNIEDLDAVDHVSGQVAGWVQRATQHDAVENLLSGTWLGHKLHPVLTDLPIGAWSMASALDVTAGRPGATAARKLVGLGLIATLPTAATGATDWSVSSGAGQRVGLVHALANLTATAVQAASWVARRRGRRVTGMALSGVGLGITGPLDQGTVLADGRIRCPWHGSVFRLADGRATRGPASVDEPSWQVKVDNGRVLVRSSVPTADA
jgi:nitrite reductase/ring-hydroxylating ferredoxin subunit